MAVGGGGSGSLPRRMLGSWSASWSPRPECGVLLVKESVASEVPARSCACARNSVRSRGSSSTREPILGRGLRKEDGPAVRPIRKPFPLELTACLSADLLSREASGCQTLYI